VVVLVVVVVVVMQREEMVDELLVLVLVLELVLVMVLELDQEMSVVNLSQVLRVTDAARRWCFSAFGCIKTKVTRQTQHIRSITLVNSICWTAASFSAFIFALSSMLMRRSFCNPSPNVTCLKTYS
jgi:hypothetical protein